MKRQRKKSSVFSSRKKSPSTRKKEDFEAIEAANSGYTKRIPTSEINSELKKGKNTKKSRKNNKKSVFKKIRTAFFMILFVGIVIGSGILIGMYAAISREMQDVSMESLALNYSSFVYYTDELGNSHELEQLFDDGYRIWIEPEEIPDVMKDAVISIEDERFYSHNGIDLKRTLGAFAGWVIEKIGGSRAEYGGSTITQQVVKNITHEKDRSAIRKIKEMMRASVMENKLSKDEILTLYLNIVYLANNCYGVEAASNIYFGKNATELNLTEAATIAGITQRPSYYDPLANPENATKKRNTVLSKMNELEKISDEEYEKAVNSPLGAKKHMTNKDTKIYSYFVDQVINDVIKDLQEQKGYTETFASQQVFSGGLKIYTTMNPDIQDAMESVFEDTSNFPSSSAAKSAQAAMVIINPETGEIKGIVGGKGKKTDSRGLNRATQAIRQPGSSFKPIAVYAPGIELEKFTAATILEDAKITIGDWSPKNSYTGFKGDIPLRKAIEISSNTAAVRALQELGIQESYDFLTNKFHLATLSDNDKALSPLSLGGLTYGVSVRELAAAYSTFANKGKYIEPHTYTKVIDHQGRILLEKSPEPETAVSEETAFIMTSLLESVIKGRNGTGKLAKLDDMPAAGKTGTTNNDHDKWFVGYTPYYAGAVWYGFDTQASIKRAGVTNNVSAKIWGLVMKKVHENLSIKEFSKPDNIIQAVVCTKTGKLASSGCSFDATEYFKSGTEPTKYCKLKHNSNGPSEENPESTQNPNATAAPSETSAPEDLPQNPVKGTDEPIIVPDKTQKPAEQPAARPTQRPQSRPTAAPTQATSPDNGYITIPDGE